MPRWFCDKMHMPAKHYCAAIITGPVALLVHLSVYLINPYGLLIEEQKAQQN